MTTERPIPTPTAVTAPYWAAARERRLVVQRCRSCTRAQFYPRDVCVRCGSPDLDWVQTSGRGTIYTFTVLYRAPAAAFKPMIPYVVGMIDLPEGVRLLTNITTDAPERVRIGAPVEVFFEEIAQDVVLPQFRLDDRGVENVQETAVA